MKRFYDDVTLQETSGGWQVVLDDRAVKTQGATPQIAPTHALAEALAAEWKRQGETIDGRSFPLRDLTDFTLDRVATAADDTVGKTLAFARTDTLCYRADPGTALSRQQNALWEPLLADFEGRENIALIRVASIVHTEQPEASIDALRSRLETFSAFTLAGVFTLASLSASMCIAMAALEDGADAEMLWNAANLEEDSQAELWGRDAEAEAAREEKRAAFLKANEFLELLGR